MKAIGAGGSSVGGSADISCERAGRERRQDAILDAPERIADAALRVLTAVLRFGRAGGDGQRPVDRLDDVRDGNRARAAREAVAAARALV